MGKASMPIYDIEEFVYRGQSDFYGSTLQQHILNHHKAILVPHRHNFYLSVIFTSGTGVHIIEFTEYEIKPGQVFMIAPGQVHEWQLSKDIQGYIFFHSKEFFDLNFTYEKVDNFPFFTCLRNKSEIIIDAEQVGNVTNRYREIIHEFEADTLMKYQKLASLVNVLYIELSRMYIHDACVKNENLNYFTKLKQLESLLNEHFKTIKSPRQYANMMHMSEKHLNRICKASINKTLSAVIADRVVLEAKRLLVYSNESITTITSELGFDDAAYFSRYFKKKTKQTPSDYLLHRQEQLKKRTVQV